MVSSIAKNAKVLVIEDDPAVRFSIVSYLQDSSFTVIEGRDGTEGLALARSAEPDVVLCDLQMPGINGMEVLRTLHNETPNLPIVVVSGTGVFGDAVTAIRNGAWDLVTKPILDMEILEHAMDSVLERADLIRKNHNYQIELEEVNRQLRSHLERFERDAIAGRKTQSQLMPPPEHCLDNYYFSRHLLPCMYLTGDFMDCFTIKPGYVGFYLADASGHGAASAFVTVLLKSFMEHYREALTNDSNGFLLSPAQTLTRLNQDMRLQHLDKYLTIFYCVVNTSTNHLTYSSGGHFPYPVLFDGKNSCFLDKRGPLVGLFARPTFTDTVLQLPKSHSIAIFSDGVLEAMPESRLSDKKSRLLQAVNKFGLSASEICSHLGLKNNADYPDDISLLIAEREV